MAAAAAAGARNYEFIDAEQLKTGGVLHRLRMVDADGRFSYSVVRPVVFADEISWQVYPILCSASSPGQARVKMY